MQQRVLLGKYRPRNWALFFRPAMAHFSGLDYMGKPKDTQTTAHSVSSSFSRGLNHVDIWIYSMANRNNIEVPMAVTRVLGADHSLFFHTPVDGFFSSCNIC